MPKVKQPISLKKGAMDVLITFCANCCHRWSRADDSPEKLRQSVAIIKKDISPNIPHHLSSQFHNELLFNFACLRGRCRPQSHDRAVLELIMDMKIRGLRFETSLLFSLELRNAHRIRGLEILNFSYLRNPLLNSLENVQLQDLTHFVFFDKCTDTELQIIGQNCPKLRNLNVSGSQKVTDFGLRALSPCSHLCFVCVSYCPVSISGINDLLSANRTIRQLSAWNDSCLEGFDCFTHSDASVYPSIEYFDLEFDYISNDLLQMTVLKFPNLTKMSICGQLLGDINILQDLRKLSRLSLSGVLGLKWDNLEPLLKSVGTNIIELSMPSDNVATDVTQSGINFISKYCANLESFSFNYRTDLDSDRLVIPPFQKITFLGCYHRRDGHITTLEFGQMLQLEHLSVTGFHMSTKKLESMILNHTDFPNLKRISTSGFRIRDDNERLRNIVSDNNLDFHFSG